MSLLDTLIRERLRVKRGDCLPFTGWNREFSRESLAALMGEVGFTVGAEVGVRKGHYSRTLCEAIPNLRLTCVDPYLPYEHRKTTAEGMEQLFAFARNNLAAFNVTFVRLPSVDASHIIADGSLDFVYIDAAHDFNNVMLDIIYWEPKVRSGGIVAGHDYVETFDCGVINAVRAYTYANGINSWYLTYDTNKPDMPCHSWFWVRR